MQKILSPHREQDGVVYVRVLRIKDKPSGRLPFCNGATADEYVDGPDYFLPTRSGKNIIVSYDDSRPASRTISSRRVEEAVETADYLKRCAEEGLSVTALTASYGVVYGVGLADIDGNRVSIGGELTAGTRWCATLREAYHRYHAAKRKSE